MTIRKGYKKSDVKDMLAVNALCYKGQECPPTDTFMKMLSISDVWIAREEEKVIAFAIVNPEGPYLWSIAVHPSFQRRGVAGNVLYAVIAYYSFSKKEKHIDLHVRNDNPAKKLYLDYGFKVTGTVDNYYGNDMLGVAMRRML